MPRWLKEPADGPLPGRRSPRAAAGHLSSHCCAEGSASDPLPCEDLVQRKVSPPEGPGCGKEVEAHGLQVIF